jgi:glycosyltransferase involved in cell wall biosynthesis
VARRTIDVGVSFGPLRTFHDGLGEFSVQLGQRIAARASALEAEHGIRFHFYMPEERHGIFGSGVRYMTMRPLHRALHLASPRFALWHTLNQHIAHRPPARAVRRVLTVHDLNHLYTKRGPSLALHSFKAWRRLASADHVVAISRHVAEDVRRVGFTGPVDVIYNGARSFVGERSEPVAGLEAGGYLFHLSRMAASKNVGAILDLAAAWPEQRFVLAGPASGSLEATAASVAARGLANVRVLADVSDEQKAWLFAHCQGFLFPSLTEGFGLPPLEAMHFGRPAFLSDRTSLPETGGHAAWYFDRFDAASMRQVVEAGLAEARLPGRADAIRRHAAGFSWDACAERYLALYLRLIGLS